MGGLGEPGSAGWRLGHPGEHIMWCQDWNLRTLTFTFISVANAWFSLYDPNTPPQDIPFWKFNKFEEVTFEEIKDIVRKIKKTYCEWNPFQLVV